MNTYIAPPKKEVSTKLQLMLEEVNQTFGHAKVVIIAAYRQALAEGFNPTEDVSLAIQERF